MNCCLFYSAGYDHLGLTYIIFTVHSCLPKEFCSRILNVNTHHEFLLVSLFNLCCYKDSSVVLPFAMELCRARGYKWESSVMSKYGESSVNKVWDHGSSFQKHRRERLYARQLCLLLKGAWKSRDLQPPLSPSSHWIAWLSI